MKEKFAKSLEFDNIREMLAQYAVTASARQKITELLPSADELEVRAALRETDEARAILEAFGTPPLAPTDTVAECIDLADKGAMLTCEQLESVGTFAAACRRLKSYLRRDKEGRFRLCSYSAEIDELEELDAEIARAVRGGRIDDNATPELAALRRKLSTAERQIKEKLDSLLRSKKECFSEGFVSVRNSRYTLPVKKEFKNRIEGRVVDTSASGSTVFIEPSSVARLTAEAELLQIEESNEERRILYTLSAMVDDNSPQIKTDIDIIKRLDFAFAKGKLSADMNAQSPQISTQQGISITKGRHPLLAKEKCVPLDFSVGGDLRGIVITGPNTGGKTVALKTVGLFVMMTQCGLHLPCESACIGLCGEVLCDIGDGQSISQNLSTFSAHMTLVTEILSRTGKDSLVLLDELGSGTDPAEGMGIAIAVLEELRARRCLFVVTTHYPQVKDYAASGGDICNARMTFDRESLRPLYRLQIGEAGESCALYIAKKLGFPRHMLECAYKNTYGDAQPDGLRQLLCDAVEEKRAGSASVRRKKALPTDGEHAASFNIGDSVTVLPQKQIGIVCGKSDGKGNIPVQMRGQKMLINHKRLQLKVAAQELYPEGYDFSVIFDTVANRKARHQMDKGHIDGVEIIIKEGNDDL